jgi:hypothetical protein
MEPEYYRAPAFRDKNGIYHNGRCGKKVLEQGKSGFIYHVPLALERVISLDQSKLCKSFDCILWDTLTLWYIGY